MKSSLLKLAQDPRSGLEHEVFDDVEKRHCPYRHMRLLQPALPYDLQWQTSPRTLPHNPAINRLGKTRNATLPLLYQTLNLPAYAMSVGRYGFDVRAGSFGETRVFRWEEDSRSGLLRMVRACVAEA